MIVYGQFSLEQVMPHIGKPMWEVMTEHGSFQVRMNSTRLKCFQKSLSCVTCGRKGRFFRLESHTQNPPRVGHNCFIRDCVWCVYRDVRLPKRERGAHLNLYGKTGNRIVLMTQDHIIPRSRGGGNAQINLQTMCYFCNQRKGNQLPLTA